MNTTALESRLRDLYSDFRTALMNRKYYGVKLDRARRNCRAIDIFLAIAAPGSGATAGWTIWKDGTASTVWLIIASIATLVAVANPFLNYPKDIERYGKLFSGHSDIYHDLRQIVSDALATQQYDDAAHRRRKLILGRISKLSADDDPHPDSKLVESCYSEVMDEIPPTSLWLP